MRTRNRRGMLLLVVLALLAMFAMLAVAFVVMTGSEGSSAKQISLKESQLDPGEKTLNDAATIVAIASNDPACPIGPFCLMEKIVGGDLIQGTITRSDTGTLSGGELLTLTVPATSGSGAAYDAMHSVGCTLTMLDGPAAGLSTKIVGIELPQPGQGNKPPMAEVLPFEGNVKPGLGYHYIINGFPYGGAGFGYNPQTGYLDAGGGTGALFKGPLALQPRNPLNWNPLGGANVDFTVPDYQDPLLAYAMPGTTPGTVQVPIPSLHRADLIRHWMAAMNQKKPLTPLTANQLRLISFRPIGTSNYTALALSGTPDHPNFTGSNPNFNPLWDGQPFDDQGKPVPYQWDVDNMGRGTPDSVWVDLGFPVRFTQEGKAYKPLFAILCLDLDGRLNVNAHGTLAQTQASYYQAPGYANTTFPGNNANALRVNPVNPVNPVNTNNGYANVSLPYPGTLPGDNNFYSSLATQAKFAGQTPQAMLVRSQGGGPADINLAPLFSSTPGANIYARPGTFNLNSYQALLQGVNTFATSTQLGRYGEVAGTNGSYPAGALPGTTGGTNNGHSPLTWNRWFSYNENYWLGMVKGPPPAGPALDAWGSPPDTQGFGAIGLDVTGRPIYLSMGGYLNNTPYDIDLSHNAAHATDLNSFALPTPDSPFSVAELERILRSPDRDAATLPTRLLAVTATSPGYLPSSPLLLHPAEITTEQYSVPVAPSAVPNSLLSQQVRAQFAEGRTHHPVDAAIAAMLTYSGTYDLAAVADLLPWEVQQGLKFDVNRPLGPGARTSGGTAVSPTTTLADADQPNMSGGSVQLYVSPNTGTNGVKNESFYYDGSGNLSPDSLTKPNFYGNSLAARQIYAKHLYVLMMMSVDLQGLDSQTGSRESTARLVAQWAVNVLAYRDHNSIMIPFSYDVYPFGNKPNKNPGWAPDYTDAHTVWGCKRPDLLITETLAFHDRRTEDLDNEVVDPNNGGGAKRKPGKVGSPAPNKDPNFDQHYRPQGSLFVELYNPWSAYTDTSKPTNPQYPTEVQPGDLLLDAKGNRIIVNGAPATNGVYLSQITAPANGQGSSPVWRLIIVDPANQRSAPVGGELRDPDDPVAANRPIIERAVYFVAEPSIAIPSDVATNRCYFSSAPTSPKPAIVAPGGYAVIGPGQFSTASPNRRQTLIGLNSTANKVGDRSGRYITLDPTDIAAQDKALYRNFVLKNNTPAPPAVLLPPQSPPPPVTVVVDSAYNPLTRQVVARRLSVSEPVGGYDPLELAAVGGPFVYSFATEAYSGGHSIDIPLDLQRANSGEAGALDLVNDGTYLRFRIIYLQRLADPTRGFVATTTASINNGTANPYRTIDAMAVDLTSFNGVVDAATNALDPNNIKRTAVHFEGLQRGNMNPGAAGLEFNLWKQEPLTLRNWSNPGPTNTGFFTKGLVSSLGYLNAQFQKSATVTGPLNASTGYPGGPPAPFPWLNWSYRPFVNEYELLMVPAVSSSKLLARNEGATPRKYFGYVDQTMRSQPPAATDSYSPTGAPTNPLLPPAGPMNTSYPHLLAMFQSGPTQQPGQSAQFHRVLAYLGVPTPFAHFTVQANPDFTGGPGQHWFHQPFNGIPTYREPGRINLNTISSADVFTGLLNFHPGLANANTWQKFVASRRGDTFTDMRITGAYPSRFMRPFRSAAGASLTPPLANGSPAFPNREIDATLMREDPIVPGRPLWQTDDTGMNTAPANGPQTPDQFQYAAMDYNRSPYFRYQGLQKLAGTTTTHSNVFAIWITVGYFEAMPAPTQSNGQPLLDQGGNKIYPDGYQLGQELGADSGDVTRHRAFYIFDRSLPIGYIRGQDVNTAKGFLLQRFIE